MRRSKGEEGSIYYDIMKGVSIMILPSISGLQWDAFLTTIFAQVIQG
jgi:hypothetical protein